MLLNICHVSYNFSSVETSYRCFKCYFKHIFTGKYKEKWLTKQENDRYLQICIMVLNPANKYKIIQQCHNFKNIFINDCKHCSFLYPVKVLYLFMEPKITNYKDETINHLNIYKRASTVLIFRNSKNFAKVNYLMLNLMILKLKSPITLTKH